MVTAAVRILSPRLARVGEGASLLMGRRRSLLPGRRNHALIYQQQRPMLMSSAAATATAIPPLPTTASPIVWTTHRLNKDQIMKVDKLFHRILWLDIFESQMLMDLMNERLGLRMTPKMRRQLDNRMVREEQDDDDNMGAASGGDAEEEAAGPVTMDVKLVSFDAKTKIKVIKEVRGALDGLGLKEAKEMVEGAPVVLRKSLKEEEANALKEKLESVGATIELVPN